MKLTRTQIIILVVIGLLIIWLIYKASTGYSAKFFDNFWRDSPAGSPNLGALGFLFTEPHNFKVGDRVSISQDAGAVFPEYDGTHTIVDVNVRQGTLSPYNIVTDARFLGNTPANGGTAKIALF